MDYLIVVAVNSLAEQPPTLFKLTTRIRVSMVACVQSLQTVDSPDLKLWLIAGRAKPRVAQEEAARVGVFCLLFGFHVLNGCCE